MPLHEDEAAQAMNDQDFDETEVGEEPDEDLPPDDVDEDDDDLDVELLDDDDNDDDATGGDAATRGRATATADSDGGDDDEDEVAGGRLRTARGGRTRSSADDDEDDVVDLDDEQHPDDVEEPLDVLLAERTASERLEEDEVTPLDEDVDSDGRGEGPTRIAPRRADEFLCSSCFLVLPRNQLADEKKLLCRDCA